MKSCLNDSMTPLTVQSGARSHVAVSDWPGCLPGLCGNMSRHAMMNAPISADAIGRLNAKPPC